MHKLAGLILAVFLSFTLVSCGGSMTSSLMGTPSQTSGVTPMNFSMQDNPPAGVTVLSFEVEVTAASLLPSDSTKSSVPLLPKPAEVELEHLQTEPALLGNINVPADTYNGLKVTFGNARMAILNQSNQTLMVGNQSCPANQVCKLSPTLNMSTLTVQAPTSPFPFTLTANSPVGLLLHFDVNASVQGDLSITPVIDLKLLTKLPGGEFERTHVVGRVTAIDATNSNFTVQLGMEGPSTTISTDSSTLFDFEGACTANNFSCLVVGQIVRVAVKLMSGGTMLATKVSLVEPEGEPAFQGTVTKIDVPNNQFQITLMDGEWDPGENLQAVAIGIPVTVQITPQAVFQIDLGGLTLPAGLTFASVGDLIVGQSIVIHPMLPFTVGGTPPNVSITVSTDRVQLEPSQITASVASVNTAVSPPTFMLGTLPPLFVNNGITQVQVITTATTAFDNMAGVAGLMTGNSVSVGGLLFNTATTPTIVADKVLNRQTMEE